MSELSNLVYVDGKIYKNGRRVGWQDKNGYRRLRVAGHQAMEHRVVYQLCHGACPEFIDHINGIRHDNRIENLRPATRKDNQGNRRRSNRELPRNVWKRETGTYVARGYQHGKYRTLGTFATLEEAQAVADAELSRYYGEFYNG